MALDHAQIRRRHDGLWLYVTDPDGHPGAICLDMLLARDYGHDTLTAVLAWAAAQARPGPAMVQTIKGAPGAQLSVSGCPAG